MNKTPAPIKPATSAPSTSTKPVPTGNNAAWDADDEDTPYGDPAKAKDAGVLESLGKAVSSPVTESEPDNGRDKTHTEPAKR